MSNSKSADNEPRPLRRDAQRNRERILTTARRLFAERGLETSFDDIATAADVGVGTVYRHYPNKDALLDELLGTAIDELEAQAQAGRTSPDPWAAFTDLVEHLADAYAKNRALEAMFLQPGRGPQRVEAAREKLAGPVAQIVERAKAAGRLPPDFAVEDVGHIHTMLSSLIRENDRSSNDWRRFLKVILDGLAAQAAAARG